MTFGLPKPRVKQVRCRRQSNQWLRRTSRGRLQSLPIPILPFAYLVVIRKSNTRERASSSATCSPASSPFIPKMQNSKASKALSSCTLLLTVMGRCRACSPSMATLFSLQRPSMPFGSGVFRKRCWLANRSKPKKTLISSSEFPIRGHPGISSICSWICRDSSGELINRGSVEYSSPPNNCQKPSPQGPDGLIDCFPPPRPNPAPSATATGPLKPCKGQIEWQGHVDSFVP